jgi:hypothetical protein
MYGSRSTGRKRNDPVADDGRGARTAARVIHLAGARSRLRHNDGKGDLPEWALADQRRVLAARRAERAKGRREARRERREGKRRAVEAARARIAARKATEAQAAAQGQAEARAREGGR